MQGRLACRSVVGCGTRSCRSSGLTRECGRSTVPHEVALLAASVVQPPSWAPTPGAAVPFSGPFGQVVLDNTVRSFRTCDGEHEALKSQGCGQLAKSPCKPVS